MSINGKLKCTAFGCSSQFNDTTGYKFSKEERACSVCAIKYWEWRLNTDTNAKCKNCNCVYELHFDSECICSRCPGFLSPIVITSPPKKISRKQRKRMAREEKKNQKRLEAAKKIEELEASKVEPKRFEGPDSINSARDFAIKNAGKKAKIYSADVIINNTMARIIGWKDDMVIVECKNENDNEFLDVSTINTVVEDFATNITDETNGSISTFILGRFVPQEDVGIAELTWNGDYYGWESL